MQNVHQQTAKALGSDALITIVSNGSEAYVEDIFTKLWQIIYKFERQFSRFLTDSELTKLNQQAGNWMAITPEFQKLLKASDELAKATDGLYNPFILPALQRAGYRKSWVPSPATANPPDYSQRQIVSANSLELKAGKARIQKDSALDLGGCGKGYLLDELADWLEKQDIQNYWLSLGGDIIAKGGGTNNKGWQIGIAQAEQPNKTLAEVKITNKRLAVATSGVTKRRGTHKGQGWHHIIDPKTGLSANTDVLTATICMPSALYADVYASCLVTLGGQAYEPFLAAHDIYDALLQTTDNPDQAILKHGEQINLL